LTDREKYFTSVINKLAFPHYRIGNATITMYQVLLNSIHFLNIYKYPIILSEYNLVALGIMVVYQLLIPIYFLYNHSMGIPKVGGEQYSLISGNIV